MRELDVIMTGFTGDAETREMTETSLWLNTNDENI